MCIFDIFDKYKDMTHMYSFKQHNKYVMYKKNWQKLWHQFWVQLTIPQTKIMES